MNIDKLNFDNRIKYIIKNAVNIIIESLDSGKLKIFLFGSMANGTARDNSDIDIGILADQQISMKKMAELCDKIDDIRTVRSIELIDFNNVSDDFRNNALKKKVILYER